MITLDITKGLTVVHEAYALNRSAGNAAAIGAIEGVMDVVGAEDPSEAVRLIRLVLDVRKQER